MCNSCFCYNASMKELSNYELCLLIRIYYERGWVTAGGNEFENEYLPIWENIQNNVKRHCNKDVLIRTGNRLLVDTGEKDLLGKFIEDYVNELESNSLGSYNNINFETQLSEFKKSIDKTQNHKSYVLHYTKHIPIIIWGLKNNYIKLKSVYCRKFPNIDSVEQKRAAHFTHIGAEYNEFDFSMIADLSELFTTAQQSNRTQLNDNKNKFHLTEQQWKLWFCIHKGVLNYIEEEDDEYFIIKNGEMFDEYVFNKTKNPDRTITGFNNQIRIILKEEKEYPKKYLIKHLAENKYKIDCKLYDKIRTMVMVNPKLKQERVMYDGFCKLIKLPHS